jgi:hypothetical protein
MRSFPTAGQRDGERHVTDLYSWLKLVHIFPAMVWVGAAAAERALDGGEHTEALRELRHWAWGFRLILVLLLVTTWTMVFKPGA